MAVQTLHEARRSVGAPVARPRRPAPQRSVPRLPLPSAARLRGETPGAKHGPLPQPLQNCYQHAQLALDLIELILSLGQQPPVSLLLVWRCRFQLLLVAGDLD